MFQSTFPRGKRPTVTTMNIKVQMFQSTFPRGKRRGLAKQHTRSYTGFNPRSREGNDCMARDMGHRRHVSIHVPARETTLSDCTFYVPEISVSIHVPARETTIGVDNLIFDKCFNPRSREGNDCVSISTKAGEQSFNPRSREGNDNRLPFNMYAKVWFQSTFPRGKRHRDWKESKILHKVSIHVPARETTGLSPWTWCDNYVSIHVPARETTAITYNFHL